MPNIATLWILFGGAFIIATAGKSKELEINGQIRDREVRLIGADVLKRFAEALPQASMDKPPVLEGRTMSILLIPKPNKD